MNKPELKMTLLPFVLNDKSAVRFGGWHTNVVRDIEFDDNSGALRLLKAMDGKKSIEDLSIEMNIDINELKELVSFLYKSGVLMDNSDTLDFDEFDIQLYKRNLNFLAYVDVKGKYSNYWLLQQKLCDSNVLLLGAGGTGSHVGEILVRMGIRNLTLVDFDKVDVSNLNRQNFYQGDIGQKKIDVLADRLKLIDKKVNIRCFDCKIHY